MVTGIAVKLFPRTVARFSAVQAMYQIVLRPDLTFQKIIDDFMVRRFGPEGYALFDNARYVVDAQLFQTIVLGACEHLVLLEEKIALFLPAGWTLEKLELATRCIFRCAAFELMYAIETPQQVIVSEYTVIAHGFLLEKGPALVNGLLDSLACHVRIKESKMT